MLGVDEFAFRGTADTGLSSSTSRPTSSLMCCRTILNAIKVADCWHLLRNVSVAVEEICQQHRACLRERPEHQQRAQHLQPALDLLPTTLVRQRCHAASRAGLSTARW
ncbi:hypothetical protein [Streptomyces sp. NPDC090798]|uniref:hypothetical protein n=1 Tax=Streptomyces sp. NPDC090798 TaxID=3365968 RepID=UPI0037FB350F